MIPLTDAWTAYQFDSAVSFFGNAIERASSERTRVGPKDKPQYVNRYELEDLLTPGFILERPASKADKERASINALRMLAGSAGSGVKIFKGTRKDG